MKVKPSKIILLSALMLLVIFSGTSFEKKRETNVLLLPSLPKPIAKEYALITSAGQGTDAYIINDIANKLMIHNYFMPQAKKDALDSVNTIVFAVGYSALGEKLHETSYETEKKRIKELLTAAKKQDITVITVFIGGRQGREKNTEELLSLVSAKSDYIITTKNGNGDGYLSELAKSNRIPLTVVNSVNDLSEPFASAFR